VYSYKERIKTNKGTNNISYMPAVGWWATQEVTMGLQSPADDAWPLWRA